MSMFNQTGQNVSGAQFNSGGDINDPSPAPRHRFKTFANENNRAPWAIANDTMNELVQWQDENPNAIIHAWQASTAAAMVWDGSSQSYDHTYTYTITIEYSV